jgi:predicted N-acyltransferase
VARQTGRSPETAVRQHARQFPRGARRRHKEFRGYVPAARFRNDVLGQ